MSTAFIVLLVLGIGALGLLGFVLMSSAKNSGRDQEVDEHASDGGGVG